MLLFQYLTARRARSITSSVSAPLFTWSITQIALLQPLRGHHSTAPVPKGLPLSLLSRRRSLFVNFGLLVKPAKDMRILKDLDDTLGFLRSIPLVLNVKHNRYPKHRRAAIRLFVRATDRKPKHLKGRLRWKPVKRSCGDLGLTLWAKASSENAADLQRPYDLRCNGDKLLRLSDHAALLMFANRSQSKLSRLPKCLDIDNLEDSFYLPQRRLPSLPKRG
jgi:hypothetical protein